MIDETAEMIIRAGGATFTQKAKSDALRITDMDGATALTNVQAVLEFAEAYHSYIALLQRRDGLRALVGIEDHILFRRPEQATGQP